MSISAASTLTLAPPFPAMKITAAASRAVQIAALSEKRSIVSENLDSIVDAFPYASTARAATVRIKPHARATMPVANPQHLSDTDLKKRRLATCCA
ncbi:hypothetical protein [Xanthobacter sp. YC-JY1]|uniref:hypothetical protein n=1 Tax=Xanthobacter sp. YC-JY1 TaxID=2419844 RepID=UPI001F2F5B12|nr:hypothetical protein [Xanthobacter sp. YC-JY1]